MTRFWLALARLQLIFAGVRYGQNVRVRGWAILCRHPDATILLGNGVVLQSLPRRYHAHMHSPVKLLADRPSAVISIGDNSRVNGACIHAVKSVSIGARCLLASGVQILDSNAHLVCMNEPEYRIHSTDEGKPVVIEDDVWLGLNVIVLPGSRIGAGSVISAGVVVQGEIPRRSIVKAAPFTVQSPEAL